MKRLHNKLLITAGAMIAIGAVLFGLGYIMGGRPAFSIGRLSNGIQTPTSLNKSFTRHTLKQQKIDAFTDIELNTEFADIIFVESDDYYISYSIQNAEEKPSFKVVNNKLVFNDSKASIHAFNTYTFFTIDSQIISGDTQQDYIKIYIPKDAVFNEVVINSNSSTLKWHNITAASLNLKNNYGDLNLSQINCPEIIITAESSDIDISNIKTKNLSLKNNYGNLSISDITASMTDILGETYDIALKDADIVKLSIKNNYGNIDLNNIQGDMLTMTAENNQISMDNINTSQIHIKNNYGDISGTNVTAPTLNILQENALCTLNSLTSEQVDIKNPYGSIFLDLTEKEASYNYDLTTSLGEIKLNNLYSEENINKSNGSVYNLRIASENGYIHVKTN